MKIRQERTIEINGAAKALHQRLKRWSYNNGYICAGKTFTRWVFQRGSKWHSVYTFDIRRIPTEVIVDAKSVDSTTVHCSMERKSWLQLATPRGRRRVSEDMDDLVATVKGPLG